MPLTAVPEIQKFKGSQEAELVRSLERADRCAEILPIGDPGAVLMGPDGKLGNGMYASSWGFYQLCKQLCPGLYRPLDELATLTGEDGVAAAAEMFNCAVRLRFREALANQLWLVDNQTHTVEAVVSPKYKFLSNLATYQTVKAALGDQMPKFQEAQLVGRWMLLRFYAAKKCFSVGDQHFFHGVHFSNHEGGQSSLHACNTVVRNGGPLTFATKLSQERQVRHVGGGIQARIRKALEKVLGHKSDDKALEAGVKGLMAQRLMLGLPTEDEEDKRRKDLAAQLSAKDRLHKTLAGRILAETLIQPHDASEPRSTLDISRHDLQQLTAWDLAVSMCRVAKTLSISAREKAEQLAYALLMGRFRLR